MWKLPATSSEETSTLLKHTKEGRSTSKFMRIVKLKPTRR